jgi:hypothetical protein
MVRSACSDSQLTYVLFILAFFSSFLPYLSHKASKSKLLDQLLTSISTLPTDVLQLVVGYLMDGYLAFLVNNMKFVRLFSTIKFGSLPFFVVCVSSCSSSSLISPLVLCFH